MNMTHYVKKALKELKFSKEEKALLSEEVVEAQKQAVASLLKGEPAGAYRQMIVIVKYCMEKNRDLPDPCQKLLKTLTICDVVKDHLSAQEQLLLSKK